MRIICDTCGRDIDALGQDNMGVDAPLCEDCWGEQQSHAAAVLKRENASLSGEVRKLRFENARCATSKRLLASFCEEADYLEWLKAEYDDGTIEWEER